MPGAVRARALRGEELLELLEAGLAALAENSDAVNALNVFPVPDGDTGTNMVLTLRAVVEEGGKARGCGAGEVAAAVARGALLGARGNSGVILSQFLRGMARALEGSQEAGAPLLSAGFREGAAAAYRAVGRPVEGTILTVMRAAAEAMAASAAQGPDVALALERALGGGAAALAATPELLPVLKQAGVVDAGGQGFTLILEGALRHLRGEEPAHVHLDMKEPLGRVREAFLAAVEGVEYGYCTQFVISGRGLDPDMVRERVSAMADSAVVIGDDTLVRVHVHTMDPQPLLAYGSSLGSLAETRVESIDEQHQEFREAHRAARPQAAVGVVAVALGEGIEALMASLGAGVVVRGGQTMNPSCQELLDGVEALRARTAILLPNNPNVLLVAQQAAGLSSRPVLVVPTRTIPQGVAAMLSYSGEEGLEANGAAMSRAASSIRSGEVVTAVHDATVDGAPVRQGQCMGLLDGVLASAEATPAEALLSVVRRAGAGPGSLVTLYWGGAVDLEGAEEAAGRLREAFPGVEVEVVHGGQPHYHYLVSVE